MSDNRDYDVPRSNEYPKGEVIPPVFDSKVHIFWGPNQPTNYPDYTPPDPEAWKKEHLNIPQVIRFIHTSPGEYNADMWAEEGGSSGGDDVRYTVTDVELGSGTIIIYWNQFINGVRIFPTNRYSLVRFDDGEDKLPFFFIGLSFRFVFPQRFPVDYSISQSRYVVTFDGSTVVPI